MDVIIISFLLTLLHYWSRCAFQQGGLWFKLANVISAFMTIIQLNTICFLWNTVNFFYYICFWLKHWFCASAHHRLFFTLQEYVGFFHEPQCGWSVVIRIKSKGDTWHEVSCPCLIKCVLPGAIQPKPLQLFVQYLVQILGGWENQNRANIAWEKEQSDPADNVEHYFRAAKPGLGTET